MRKSIRSIMGGSVCALVLMASGCNEDRVASESLAAWERTNTNYLDLYNLTCPDDDIEMRQALFRYLDEQKAYAGKIRLGISNSRLHEERKQLYKTRLQAGIDEINITLHPEIYARALAE